MPYTLLAEEIPKLVVNSKAIQCEEFESSELSNLKQNELESIYCGYKAGIDLIEISQTKQFESHPINIKTKLSIQKSNIEKTMKCIEHKAKVDETLKKMDAAYVPNCDKYKGFSDLTK